MKQSESVNSVGFGNNLGQFVLFDWFQFTIIFDLDKLKMDFENFSYLESAVIHYFNELFGISRSMLEHRDRGINGYSECYVYNNTIECYYNPKRPEMGINFKLSGQGCREFDSLGLDWYSFIDILLGNYSDIKININRVDIAIDDFTNDYFDLSKLYKYISKGKIITKFRKSLEIISRDLLETDKFLGAQIQLGSKSSNVEITFYDKKLERLNNDYEVEGSVEYWTRTELRFRHEYARKVLENIISNMYIDTDDINYTVKGILYNYVRFIELDHSRKYNCTTSLWWHEYLERVDKLKFNFKYKESDITRKRNWIDHSVSKTQLQVILSEYDYTVDHDENTKLYLLSVINSGQDKLKLKDMECINNERIKNGLVPLPYNELENIIEDLKRDILLG